MSDFIVCSKVNVWNHFSAALAVIIVCVQYCKKFSNWRHSDLHGLTDYTVLVVIFVRNEVAICLYLLAMWRLWFFLSIKFQLDFLMKNSMSNQFHFFRSSIWSHRYKLIRTRRYQTRKDINSSAVNVIGLVEGVKPILWPPAPIAGPCRAIQCWHRVILAPKIVISIPFNFAKKLWSRSR